YSLLQRNLMLTHALSLKQNLQTSLGFQYEPAQPRRNDQREPQTTVIEELCIHVYKTRKKIAATQDKNSPRPFVSVNNAS
ncbi:MAG TPA: hypothetical protein VE616_09560, partial [Candidatus Udaeobacter sp.]|nr:hypothetical protein [Candidatus Udaeobacter sp.]